MGQKRRDRRLSLPKNWRIVKKTSKDGEIFYNIQYKYWLLFGWDYVCNGNLNPSKYETIDEAKRIIQENIIYYVAEYDKRCGKEIEKTEIINIG